MKAVFSAIFFAAAFFASVQHAFADERRAARTEFQVTNYVPAAVARHKRQQIHLVSNDRGGNVVLYAQRVARVRSEPSIVVFKGTCASACTLFLSLSPTRTCIMPGASFAFHRAYGARRDMNEWGTDYLMRQYPQWVRSWIGQRGGLRRNLIHMDFAYASRFMPVCQVASA